MEIIVYAIIGGLIGAAIAWLISKSQSNKILQQNKDSMLADYKSLELEMVYYKANTVSELKHLNEQLEIKEKEVVITNGLLSNLNEDLNSVSNQLSNKISEISLLEFQLKENLTNYSLLKNERILLQNENIELTKHLSKINADFLSASNDLKDKRSEIDKTKIELDSLRTEWTKVTQQLATTKANYEGLGSKIQLQKNEMENLGKKFHVEFENIANKIIETKSQKFTDLNKDNLKSILEPLGKDIISFKARVEEVYTKESEQRFHLGERVKELAALNQVITEEARNLTNALKGESKTQGRWGEMILESILEKSGLRKDVEYFMEHELKDENGKPVLSESEGKKMRPDVVIKYPDNRNVIIDSKVSLNAFTRLVAAKDIAEQKLELKSHLSSIKTHIIMLSAKGYDTYNKALDFVMLFIPSEAAYIAAMQADPDLWNFAYDKRILLLSPTNLITSLKLIHDLWKREYQNQNAQAIAKSGTDLYEKFVGFINSMDNVGKHIKNAQDQYDVAYKQLSTGKNNLVTQVRRLKDLGLSPKKDFNAEFIQSVEMKIDTVTEN